MNEHIYTLPQPLVYPPHCGLQMWPEVCCGAVHNVESVALDLDTLRCVCIYAGEPGRIEDLNESAYGMRVEEGGVEDCREGAEV